MPASPVPRPKTVEISFWLYLAGAALGLVGTIVAIANYGNVRDQALRQLERQGQGDVLPESAVDAIVNTSFAVGLIFGLIGLVAYVLFAIFLRKGHNWARIVLTVLAGLAIFGVIGAYGIGAIQFLCLAAATVLAYLPASNAYFRAAGEQRRAQRAATMGGARAY